MTHDSGGGRVRLTGHPFYKAQGMISVSPAQQDFMRRRIGGLLNYADLSGVKMIDLLANAYLIGLKDAAEIVPTPEPPHVTD